MHEFKRRSATAEGHTKEVLLMVKWLIPGFLLAWGASLAAEEPTLRVTHPSASEGILEVEGVSGTFTGPLRFSVELSSPETGPGVRGWSFGLSHDPNLLHLLGATLSGTAAEEASFSTAEVLPEGVVSSAIVDGDPAVVLPPGVSSTLLYVEYEGKFPAKDTAVQTRLRLLDGLTGSEGVVRNQLTTWDGSTEASVTPLLENLTVLLSGFEYSPLFDVLLETRGATSGSQGQELRGFVKPGSQPVYLVTALLNSKLPSTVTSGAQGWSLGILHDGGLLAVETVTTEGTDGGGLIRGGFERHEIVDNETGQGIVSGVVLSFSKAVALPAQGRSSLLRIEYRLLADTSVLGASIQGQVQFKDKLRGEGQPVNNVVTYLGESNRPLVQRALSFDLTVGDPPRQAFVRGDANNDSRVDIADAIWLLGDLFLGGPDVSCFDAADTNADGEKDVSDVAFSINYQFLGGPHPPAPFPACGVVEEQDLERCPLGSTRCAP
jgi:hypothetical protein